MDFLYPLDFKSNVYTYSTTQAENKINGGGT